MSAESKVDSQEERTVRYSFLVRKDGLTHAEFSDHYENVHGPLALAQQGFLKHTIEYVQNHCLERVAGDGFEIDGITATTQRPRPDYSVGFLQEPDYVNVQVDERVLLDLEKLRTVQSRRGPLHGSGGITKYAALCRGDAHRAFLAMAHPRRWRTAQVDDAPRTRHDNGDANFDVDVVAEAWTDRPLTALPYSPNLHVWHVREVVLIPLP